MSSNRLSLLGSVINPLSLGHLALWIDPTDASSISTDTGGVSQANDKSGNGYHLTQGTSGNRPDYSSTLNGRNIITFAGGPDYLQRTSSTNIGRNVAGLTAYMAWKTDSTPTARQNLLVIQDATTATRFAFYAGLTSNKLTTQARRIDAETAATATGSANLGTGWHIGTAVIDHVAGTITQYLDGASDGSASLSSSGGNSSDTASPSIVLSSGNSSFDLVGGFGGAAVFHAPHDAAARKAMWGFYRNRLRI